MGGHDARNMRPTDIATNYARVVETVAHIAHRCGRSPEEITIVAVSKGQGVSAICEAIAAGARDFGENYVQEAREKIAAVKEPVQWHMIGNLQRNKAKLAVELFTLIHSLDCVELARELNRRGEQRGQVVRTLIEVNVAEEMTKSGVRKAGLRELMESVEQLPFLRVEGLMGMPPYHPDPQNSRPYFRQLARLRKECAALRIRNVEPKELSMGMSEDYPVAIEEGATILRVGRAIFGERA